MTHQHSEAEAHYVAWARKRMTPWFSARKRAVQMVRDGTPIPKVARLLNVARQWVHKWYRRFLEGGKHWEALAGRSSRPKTIRTIRHEHVDAVLAAKKRFPQILTDRGIQFTQQPQGSEHPSLFTQALDQWGIRHIMGRPHHPRTQGKIERWHRSIKHEWFAFRDVQEDAEGVRLLLSAWVEHYNTERPHWALGLRTPLEALAAGFSSIEDVAAVVNEVPG